MSLSIVYQITEKIINFCPRVYILRGIYCNSAEKKSLNTVSFHDANFVANGDTAGCQNDNLWCPLWKKVGIRTIIILTNAFIVLRKIEIIFTSHTLVAIIGETTFTARNVTLPLWGKNVNKWKKSVSLAHWNGNVLISLNNFVIGCIKSCHFDNFRDENCAKLIFLFQFFMNV